MGSQMASQVKGVAIPNKYSRTFGAKFHELLAIKALVRFAWSVSEREGGPACPFTDLDDEA